MRNIIVVPYNPRWSEMFRREAAQLAAIFGPACLAIHHIGSTSVPGLKAKPIIDMLPVVRDIEAVARFHEPLIGLGYEPMGENGVPGRRYFRKGGDEQRSHHMHVFEEGHAEVARHLSFRDYLRVYPETAAQYAALKSALAQQFPHDIYAYMDGKDAFIKGVIELALG